MTDGAPIATGRAADIFAAGPGAVIKRDREGRDPEREAAAMRHARAYGYPAPEVLGVEGADLTMRRIDGPTMSADLAHRPWTVRAHAQLLADLHNRLHAIPAPAGLPSRLGPGAATIHGDLHPDNVLMSPNGPVVIDWANAGAGTPADDIAMTWLIVASSDMPGGRFARGLARIGRNLFVDTFLARLDRAAAARRLEAIGELRLADRHVHPHEAEAVRRLVSANS